MTSPQWFLLVGGLLLFMGLSTTILKRSPFNAANVYLVIGLLVGPTVLNLFHFNPLEQSALFEVLTEVAVLISLFATGVKITPPFRLSRWRKPMLLATVSMTLTVAMIAGFAWYMLGMSPGAAVLLGAILAPTDAVLAMDVEARSPEDHSQLRFNLACEAGMNDGTAFPMVMLGLGMLGLHDLGESGLQWVLVDVLWATVGGIAIGVAAGASLARVCWILRKEPRNHELLDDFLGLGLIGFVYGVSELIHVWGFLAVFFSAVALRQTELSLRKSFRASAINTDSYQSAADADSANSESEPPSTVSEGSLVFKEHLERLSVVLMILLLGGTLFVDSWSWDAIGLALFVFLIARPVSVFISFLGTHSSIKVSSLTGWFGVRGIGSLYYLMFAIEHGLPESLALQLIQLTLIVVTLSIVIHGISVKPLLRYLSWRPLRSPEK